MTAPSFFLCASPVAKAAAHTFDTSTFLLVKFLACNDELESYQPGFDLTLELYAP